MLKIIHFILLTLLLVTNTTFANPPGSEIKEENLVYFLNGELSRFLIHMSYAGWTDEIVKSHTSAKFQSEYKSGAFSKFKDFGRVMGFNGIHQLEGDQYKSQSKAIVTFENTKAEVDAEIVFAEGKSRLESLTIVPLISKHLNLDQPDC